MYPHDDICAIATGSVQSAIAIVRISGNNIKSKLDNIFVFKKQGLTLAACQPSRLYRAMMVSNNKIIDDAMMSIFYAPHSYSGEDMLEIYCHGSLYIQEEILKILQQHDIRLAEPGEFTLRAYLNGKMDMTQVEAVNDIVNSRDSASHQIAIQQLKGDITSEIRTMRKSLLDLLSLVELELDFSEEDVEFASHTTIREMLLQLTHHIEKLSLSYEYGNALKSGISVAIVGETNVGKSTLMNALMQEERSIVSSIPGTTRDVIEDCFTYKGVTFRFADTAGIAQTENEIEKIGIARAKQKASQANIILMLEDAQKDIHPIIDEYQLWSSQLQPHQQLFLILNKSDKVEENVLNEKLQYLNQALQIEIIHISAKFKQHLNALMDVMFNYVQQLNVSGSEYIISNARQYYALKEAQHAARQALHALDAHYTTDLMAEELKLVNEKLAVVTGEVLSTEVLNEIFKNFCIGK